MASGLFHFEKRKEKKEANFVGSFQLDLGTLISRSIAVENKREKALGAMAQILL